MNKDSYGIDSIQSLTFTEGVRQRIQMYLGSANVEGIWQGLKEIINNSTDEALGGYGNEIIITINEKEQIFSVRDFGRSVPYGIRENGENVLVSIFSKSHTGGKFNHKVYAQSVGYNGLGASATCLSSEYFIVKSFRDNKMGMARWDKGENTDYQEVDNVKEKTGTYIEYKPDFEVYKDAEEKLSFNRVLKEVENISYLNNKIKFVVINAETNEKKEFYSENGIVDFIKNKATKPLMKAPIICSKSDETDTVEVAFMWTGGQSQFYVFVNGGYCVDGGQPVTGAKMAITNQLKKYIGKDVSPDSFRKGLVYVVNCKVLNPSFEGQTKSKINNPSLKTLTNEAFKEGLEYFVKTSEFSKIADLIKRYDKADKAADKERDRILNEVKNIEKETKKKAVLAEKLKDCKYHDENSCLYICEGDSAAGTITATRDSSHIAVLPIRGKIINALKHPLDKVLENEEVQDIIKVCGCGILDRIKTKELRYNKICFAADADPDGKDIICLLLVLFYVLMPELIFEGRIYWAQFPLCEAKIRSKKYYLYTKDEIEEFKENNPEAKIEYNKGLGEMEQDTFAEVAFGEKARLTQFTMEDVDEAIEILNILLGNENKKRTDYIFENINFDNVEGE